MTTQENSSQSRKLISIGFLHRHRQFSKGLLTTQQKNQLIFWIRYGFKEEEDAQVSTLKKKKKKTTKQDAVNKYKKTSEEEKELPKIVSNQQPLFDNIALTSGVALTFDGRKRLGPRPNTVDLQSLTLTS